MNVGAETKICKRRALYHHKKKVTRFGEEEKKGMRKYNAPKMDFICDKQSSIHVCVCVCACYLPVCTTTVTMLSGLWFWLCEHTIHQKIYIQLAHLKKSLYY